MTQPTKHVIAISGGKDSTAMAVLLLEREPRDYIFLITPTGDELPEMLAHWKMLEERFGAQFVKLGRHTLDSLIEEFGALPNWRQRWCTRMLKIEPCLAWIRAHKAQGFRVVLYVGLRADEEVRQGLYADDVETDFPLRRWNMDVNAVWNALKERNIRIPKRTDCARCYGQRLTEWYELWRKYPDIYADAVAQEKRIGHTFRSPGRDTWPAPLDELAAEFARGRKPRGLKVVEDEDEQPDACRVCRF